MQQEELKNQIFDMFIHHIGIRAKDVIQVGITSITGFEIITEESSYHVEISKNDNDLIEEEELQWDT
jgi:hypothetical protein